MQTIAFVILCVFSLVVVVVIMTVGIRDHYRVLVTKTERDGYAKGFARGYECGLAKNKHHQEA